MDSRFLELPSLWPAARRVAPLAVSAVCGVGAVARRLSSSQSSRYDNLEAHQHRLCRHVPRMSFAITILQHDTEEGRDVKSELANVQNPDQIAAQLLESSPFGHGPLGEEGMGSEHNARSEIKNEQCSLAILPIASANPCGTYPRSLEHDTEFLTNEGLLPSETDPNLPSQMSFSWNFKLSGGEHDDLAMGSGPFIFHSGNIRQVGIEEDYKDENHCLQQQKNEQSGVKIGWMDCQLDEALPNSIGSTRHDRQISSSQSGEHYDCTSVLHNL